MASEINKGENAMYRFKYFGHHVEVYDVYGNFLFSADNEEEAYSILRDL